MEQNLNYYKIFYEVAKSGNISKAAENLYISQPAVSKSVTKLEQALGHTLFIRSKKEILEKSNLMLLDKGNISRIYIDRYFEKNHINPGQVLEINNMDLLIDFASIGMGVACVVREFVSSYIESGQVIEVPLDYAIPERTVGFLYDEHSLNSTAKKFLEFCK